MRIDFVVKAERNSANGRLCDPMKYALLSDIHGNLAALKAAIADARRRGCACESNPRKPKSSQK